MNYRISLGRRSQILILILFLVTVATFYLFGIREDSLRNSNLNYFSLNVNLGSPGFLVYTPGCRIPELNAFDKSILKYLESTPTIQCSDKPPLIQSNQTSIWVVRNALENYAASRVSDLDCCYTPFERDKVNPHTFNAQIDDSIRLDNECIPFTESANILTEFIQVTCKLNGTSIYKDYHAFIVPKARASAPGEGREPTGLSVLIVGADALSRLNFYRQMPRTKDFLHSLEAVELFGYNKVHDNTFPNLVPMLSGHSVDEIRRLCWSNDSSFFDDCPWIWKNFSSNNYYTAFGEDAYKIGLFNYFKNGFLEPPTTYYLRPYIAANEKWIGHSQFLNTKYCVGCRFAAEVLLDYAYKFSVNMTLSNKKFWAFFWETSLTHDFINVPANNDNLFFTLFKNIAEKNILNNTAVFFMSDHGMRWGPIRETYQGRMEEHLPFMYIMLPDWFKDRYRTAVKNLNENQHLLTTHYDIYETMKDLLDLDKLRVGSLKSRTSESRHNRGISLFLRVPTDRTCRSAGIEPTWCTCQRSKRISTSDKDVRRAVDLAIDYLNNLLSKYKECAQLRLAKVSTAHVEDEEEMIKTKAIHKFSDYVVNFVTEPGLAKFEATVRHQSDSDEMTILGDISRINIYGSQSKCISNYRMKLYCFCI